MVPDVVCIREFFAAAFRASVRQKARWVTASVAGLGAHGWRGDFLDALHACSATASPCGTNFVNVLGYFVVLPSSGFGSSTPSRPTPTATPRCSRKGLVWYCILANAWCSGCGRHSQLLQPTGSTVLVQGLLAVPRMVWGNVINFMATARAVKLYTNYLRTGKLIAWDKTAHVYPSEEELGGQRRKLGDLVLERGLVPSTS
jgi:adsorption protein B